MSSQFIRTQNGAVLNARQLVMLRAVSYAETGGPGFCYVEAYMMDTSTVKVSVKLDIKERGQALVDTIYARLSGGYSCDVEELMR